MYQTIKRKKNSIKVEDDLEASPCFLIVSTRSASKAKSLRIGALIDLVVLLGFVASKATLPVATDVAGCGLRSHYHPWGQKTFSQNV